MKYDRRQIMKAAWRKYRCFSIPFAQALRMSWYEARTAAARYNVYGQRIGQEAVVLGCGVNTERAGELEWMNKCSYDRIWITATGSAGRATQRKGSGRQAA